MNFKSLERHDGVYEVLEKLQLAFAVGIRVKNRPIYRTQIPAKLTFAARASVPTSYKTTTAGSALAPQYRFQ